MAQRLTIVGRGGRHPTVVTGALEELRAIGARRDRSELSRLGRVQARILPRHELDDIEFRPTLRHHSARRLPGLDCARFAFDGDARLDERVEKTRIKTRIGAAGVRLRGQGQAQCGGGDQQRGSSQYKVDGAIFETSGSRGRISGSLDDEGDRSIRYDR